MKITKNWIWHHNYVEDPGGRIWILWNPKIVEFQLRGTRRQVIHGTVKVKGSDMIFDLIMVYGLCTCLDRREMWYELTQYNMRCRQPWLVMGDFNSILHIEDRVVGSQVQEAELRDFKQCLLDTGLTELKNVGRNYTWTNEHTYSCIDKALVNAMWVQSWTHLECSILDPRFSDHNPMCVTIEAGENTGPKPFRFFSYLADHPEFMQAVENNWKSQIQASTMNEDSIKGVIGTNKWRNIEESSTKQKAKVFRLKEGDSNTTYFHACMKNIQAQNHITKLTDANGTVIQDAKGIHEEILSFYRGLLGTATKQLTLVQPHIMELGPVLNREQQLALIAKVTTEDKTWPIMGKEITQAVLQFFDTGVILMKNLKWIRDFKYHPKCSKVNIVQLGFADDHLLFSRCDAKSVQVLFDTF
ncbi:hypothetical protein H5410_052087 [Solanum commersonii]|uniref:Exo_endo_phos domain-containing protein n=1 Tax=Solanum commersonii TaxID=4109 RepID=A0A9J5X2D5_SOLCO|nr:hypothetical protein H5410_052087 [Solanum commersonii]